MVEHGDLITSIFGERIDPSTVHTLAQSVILTSKNDDALAMNEKVLQLLPGPSKTYYSADSIDTDDPMENHRFPTEFLHRQTPSGMALHELTLKVGAIVMLLRNMRRGLCNGTRLIVKAMHDRFLDLEVLTGSNKGERIILPRIELKPSDSHLPFILKRRQFPIRLAFVMTINKSQGQTFDIVGIYLPEPVFSHGQLYVALSRSRSPQSLKVKVVDGLHQGKLIPTSDRVFTKNVVFQEVLQESFAGSTLALTIADNSEEMDIDGFQLGFDDPNFDKQPDEEVDTQATTLTYCDSQATTLLFLESISDDIVDDFYEDPPQVEDYDCLDVERIFDDIVARHNLHGVEFEPPIDTSPDVLDIHGNLL